MGREIYKLQCTARRSDWVEVDIMSDRTFFLTTKDGSSVAISKDDARKLAKDLLIWAQTK